MTNEELLIQLKQRVPSTLATIDDLICTQRFINNEKLEAICMHKIDFTVLRLDDRNISGAEVVVLMRLLEGNTILTRLDLSHNLIDLLGVLALAVNETITILDLNCNDLGNAEIELLATNRHIERLDISYNRNVDDAGAIALAAMKKLKFICINGTKIGLIGIESLATSNTLAQLQFDTKIPKDDHHKCFAAIASSTTLERVIAHPLTPSELDLPPISDNTSLHEIQFRDIVYVDPYRIRIALSDLEAIFTRNREFHSNLASIVMTFVQLAKRSTSLSPYMLIEILEWTLHKPRALNGKEMNHIIKTYNNINRFFIKREEKIAAKIASATQTQTITANLSQ